MLSQINRSLLAGPSSARVGISALQSHSHTVSIAHFMRSQSTAQTTPSMDPASISQSMDKTQARAGSEEELDLFNYKRNNRRNFNNNKLDLGESKNSLDSTVDVEFDAFKYAQSLPLLGHEAGRGIQVFPGKFRFAINPFDRLTKANNLFLISRIQSHYMKPSKRKAQKKFMNKKKRFNKGIKELFNIVSNAVRKGY